MTRRVGKKVKVPWAVFYNHCRFCPSRMVTVTPTIEWTEAVLFPHEERQPVEIICSYLVHHSRSRCEHLKKGNGKAPT